MSLPYKNNTPANERMWTAVQFGAGFGTLIGTVQGTWQFQAVKGETAAGGLGKALSVIGGSVVTYAAIALAYSATEVALEQTRGQADWRNGALAGLAAGAVVGLKKGSLSAAAGAGAAFCFTSCFVDATNGRLRSNPFTESGAPVNPYRPRLAHPKF